MKIVLAGAGHTHALCLLEWKNKYPEIFKKHQITLVSPYQESYYSGMWTGLLQGIYSVSDLAIEAEKLAQLLGVEYILGEIESVLIKEQKLKLKDLREISYDILSINVGGFAEAISLNQNTFSIKPLAPWYQFLIQKKPQSVSILGGGIAGCEVALGLRTFLGPKASISICEAKERIAPLAPRSASEKIEKLLKSTNIQIHTNALQAIPSDLILVSTGLKAPSWLKKSGLELVGDYIAIDDQLRTSIKNIFSVGDVAQHRHHPWARSGVYSVRQAPILATNIFSAAEGQPLQFYHPQKNFLALMTVSPTQAIAFWGPFHWGPFQWLQSWKDRIDRQFMKRFMLQ